MADLEQAEIKICYYCGRGVKPEEHRQVQRVQEFWLGVVADTFDGVTPENSFVHMGSVAKDEQDIDGNVVICAKDLVREMYENINLSV